MNNYLTRALAKSCEQKICMNTSFCSQFFGLETLFRSIDVLPSFQLIHGQKWRAKLFGVPVSFCPQGWGGVNETLPSHVKADCFRYIGASIN